MIKIPKKIEKRLNTKYLYFEVIWRMGYSILAFSNLDAIMKKLKENQ
jgi:hypothetical protein